MRKRTIEIAKVYGFNLNKKGQLESDKALICENSWGSGFVASEDKSKPWDSAHFPTIREAIYWALR